MPSANTPISGNQKAYLAIKKLITDGDLPEGSPIRQEEIATSLGLSKIPVREALIRLESDGFIKFTPNVGATVAVFTVNDHLELLDIRLALECKALELAIPNMVQKDIENAQQILHQYAQAKTEQERSDLNMEFHHCIYAPSMRPRLLQMISSAQDQMGKILRKRISQAAGSKRSHVQHQEILDACANADLNKAVKLLKKHIEQTKKEVLAYFRHID
ncbi:MULTISPECIES: GntR family transcriptional regulator [unclassified Acinetobacter]|uniref:GntR family transcriptional regulator n=1 Tax=unclassified Acinetobacter TaxID=196816 RepID=UPI0018A8D011|nr:MULTISPECIES: GntR family transcriptional regulator [unclassified Acinetobacter]MBJ9955322.1 GntR family transcriptional regulator [Acinetobacter baumannii]